jgi:hypothetical protein
VTEQCVLPLCGTQGERFRSEKLHISHVCVSVCILGPALGQSLPVRFTTVYRSFALVLLILSLTHTRYVIRLIVIPACSYSCVLLCSTLDMECILALRTVGASNPSLLPRPMIAEAHQVTTPSLSRALPLQQKRSERPTCIHLNLLPEANSLRGRGQGGTPRAGATPGRYYLARRPSRALHRTARSLESCSELCSCPHARRTIHESVAQTAESAQHNDERNETSGKMDLGVSRPGRGL